MEKGEGLEPEVEKAQGKKKEAGKRVGVNERGPGGRLEESGNESPRERKNPHSLTDIDCQCHGRPSLH